MTRSAPSNLNCYKVRLWQAVARYKNIPIVFLKDVQARFRKTPRPAGFYYRFRFRGPRFDTHKGHTTKANANRFSVYLCTRNK